MKQDTDSEEDRPQWLAVGWACILIYPGHTQASGEEGELEAQVFQG